MDSNGELIRARGRGRSRTDVETSSQGSIGEGDMGKVCGEKWPKMARVSSTTSLGSENSADSESGVSRDSSLSEDRHSSDISSSVGHISLRDTVPNARLNRLPPAPSVFPNPFANGGVMNNGVRPHCEMAKKLPPAVGREKVVVTTNVFPIEVENRMVYRYDVRITTSARDTSKERVRDLCKGDRDDAEVTVRHRKCMLLLRRGLELYRLLSENGAYIYDLSSTLFTNEEINKQLLPRLSISVEQMTDELRCLMGNVDVHVEVTPCVESAHTFKLADFSNSVNSDLARQDHSLRQFFEILTNQSPLQNDTHFAFGSGKLFPFDGRKFGLATKQLSDGRTLVSGADKGIRFIEGTAGSGIIPALVLDSKKAAFFDAVELPEMVRKVLMKNDDPSQPFPVLNNERMFKEFHRRINDIVRDLRLQHTSCSSRSFVASGLSDKPVGQLMAGGGRGGKAKMTLVEFYQKQGWKIRGDLPAVRLSTPFGTSFFPMEVLSVAPFQRVPISKQTPSQMKDTIKECAVPPTSRFSEISRNLQALDLDQSRRFNPYLAAFGVHISNTPLQVEGHRRAAPKVYFAESDGSKGAVNVDNRNANWKMTNGKGYLVGANLKCWYVLYDDERDRNTVLAFVDALMRECRRKGIVMSERVVEHVPFEDLDECFTQIRQTQSNERVFVMYIDSRDGSHDELKLCEVLYQVVTQHIHITRAREAPKKIATLENIINKLNCKNFGQCYGIVPESFAANKWINSGQTLIIGYDVCHPEPQPKHERRLKLPPTQPSVLGISFNGAACAETFIGDYAFQEPRKEEVTGSLLEERAFWIMKLFTENRKCLPDTVVITRDGVSEGQFRMVMENEVEAIRTGIHNFGVDVAGRNDYAPKIVCIIACKRHFKRFAIETDRGYENCLPLTVIDKEVTRPDVTEFFMQSHKVIKGTGKLPSYSMPVNEANFTMDEAQSLMMALCFTHQIVNQAISIPEPVYQADEWAKRGRNNFKAMLRRAANVKSDLPKTPDGSNVDWKKITTRLCYQGKALQLTRANA